MKKIAIIGLVVLGLLLTSCGAQSDQYLLQLKEGDTFEAVLRNSREVLQKMTDFYVKNDQTFDIGYAFTVTSAKDGKYTIEARFTSLKIDMMGAGERLAFDSSDAEKYKGTVFYPYNKLLGKSFTFELGKDGKVKEIEGFDTLIKDLRRDFRVLPREENEVVLEEMELYFGPDKFKEDFQRYFAFLPGKAVKKGDTWEKSLELRTEIPLNITTVYTLKDVTDDSYVITFVSDVATPKDQEGREYGFYDIVYEVAGKGEGEFTVGKDSFWVTKYAELQNLDGSMSLRDPNDGDKPVTVPIKIEMILGID